MSRLNPDRLHTRFAANATPIGPASPRRYTLTHSDSTGDLFLSVATDYDRKQMGSWYTRVMRDEVLAEWRDDGSGPTLHVYCHVSGGLIVGSAGWRYQIFRRELPLVLEAFRHGDRAFLDSHADFEHAPVVVHFRARQAQYRRSEPWGSLADYRVTDKSGALLEA